MKPESAVVAQQLGALQAIAERSRQCARMQDAEMIDFREGIHRDLPVRLEHGRVGELIGYVLERIVGEMIAELAHVVGQRFPRFLREVDEDETLPDVAMNGREAGIGTFEASGEIFLPAAR